MKGDLYYRDHKTSREKGIQCHVAIIRLVVKRISTDNMLNGTEYSFGDRMFKW